MLDWLFRNRETGEVTIAQFPNLALWVFAGAAVARWLVPDDHPADTAFGWLAVGALGWWAADEVVRGVNPWRRLLGAVGLVLAARGLVGLIS